MRIHRAVFIRRFIQVVVNCFQFLNFNEDSQDPNKNAQHGRVVNCFQFLNFNEDSQEACAYNTRWEGCELLSVP